MIPAQVIKKKRDGDELTDSEIKTFISEYLLGQVADYQMSALLMAIFHMGMTKKETWALTDAMLHSGEVCDLSQLTGFKVDKHSTGGVGDKTSLIIGPIVACAGIIVPMISGRGLGHTGGTLDKLESLQGFNTQLSLEEFKRNLAEFGICFIGQTKEICPADRKIYALRDVTGTVESLPLISASIMSKKLAEGIDAITFDVKWGSGAFMKSKKQAMELAQSLLAIAKASGKRASALITDMNQPLGEKVGNALEVQECLDVMSGSGPEDLRELSLHLSGQMIWLGQKAKNAKQGYLMAKNILESGQALNRFKEVVKIQGGTMQLPKASLQTEVLSPKKGFVKSIDVEKVGIASLVLGAGRRKMTDVIDMSAGLTVHKKIGDFVNKGEKLVTLHHSERSEDVMESTNLIYSAYEFSLQKVKAPTLILKTLV